MPPMKVTTKSLRTRAREILESVDRGEPVTITYRGKPRARLVSIDQENNSRPDDDRDMPVFGIWKDRREQDIQDYIDSLREGRFDAD